jgi:regulator of RNase E activity RraA
VVEKSRVAEVAKKALAQQAVERERERKVSSGAKLVKMFHLEALEG